jgi:hypothetical protein
VLTVKVKERELIQDAHFEGEIRVIIDKLVPIGFGYRIV